MISLQFPTVSPVTRLMSLHNSSYNNNENPLSSLKPAGKGIEEGPNLALFSPAASSVPKSRLVVAASFSAADAGIDDERSVIQLPGELLQELMPKHVAIIMDGNGRWAKKRGLAIQRGHKVGSEKLRDLVCSSCKLGIKVLTCFAFSTENWNRSMLEVGLLMRVFEDFIYAYAEDLMERYGVRFSVIGNRSKLPKSLQSAISSVEESSKSNKGMHFVGALSYSGRYDIVEATKKIASNVERGIVRAKDIDETLFGQQLTTGLMKFPDPDLLIRTSGEMRMSNFLLWQMAYTEFYFSDKLFPDFGEDELIEALISFQQRHRRYGKR